MRPLFLISGVLTMIASVTFFVIYDNSHPINISTVSDPVNVAVSSDMSASVFFTESVVVPGLQGNWSLATTTGQKIKILIVPGHEPNFGGTEFKDLKERDMVVDLGYELSEYLKSNPRYEVLITRNKESWNPTLQKYFDEEQEDIKVFMLSQKTEMMRLVDEGKIVRVDNKVKHNDAPRDVALRLYGINKWANEQKVDIILHIHFNDSAPRRHLRAGEYSGFSIYIPEKQYSNAEATAEIAPKIFSRLARFFAVSNLPQEREGIVETQDLIAVGSNNTADGASMLIEYGYIYEPQFANLVIRKALLKELALQTYLGLVDFFGETPSIAEPHGTTLLPYLWDSTLRKTTTANKATLALQAALTHQGFYPPKNMTKNDCPLSGVFGSCTRAAIGAFQGEWGIPGNGTVVGIKTRAKLNELYLVD